MLVPRDAAWLESRPWQYFEKDRNQWSARWLAHLPGSGFWFNPGRTLIVQTHADVNRMWELPCPCQLYGFDNCIRKYQAEARIRLTPYMHSYMHSLSLLSVCAAHAFECTSKS